MNSPRKSVSETAREGTFPSTKTWKHEGARRAERSQIIFPNTDANELYDEDRSTSFGRSADSEQAGSPLENAPGNLAAAAVSASLRFAFFFRKFGPC